MVHWGADCKILNGNLKAENYSKRVRPTGGTDHGNLNGLKAENPIVKEYGPLGGPGTEVG